MKCRHDRLLSTFPAAKLSIRPIIFNRDHFLQQNKMLALINGAIKCPQMISFFLMKGWDESSTSFHSFLNNLFIVCCCCFLFFFNVQNKLSNQNQSNELNFPSWLGCISVSGVIFFRTADWPVGGAFYRIRFNPELTLLRSRIAVQSKLPWWSTPIRTEPASWDRKPRVNPEVTSLRH